MCYYIHMNTNIYRSHKIRLYPNQCQLQILKREAEGYLAVYNWGLTKYEEQRQLGQQLPTYKLLWGLFKLYKA